MPFIPSSWLRQLRVGGKILTHLHRDIPTSSLVLLTVDASGIAHGQFVADAGCFMVSRTHQTGNPYDRLGDAVHQDGRIRPAPPGVSASYSQPHMFLAALLMPGVTSLEFTPTNGEPQEWLFDQPGSWACHQTLSRTVEQYGPRHLWNELETAHRRWHESGQPAPERFGLTIDLDGRHTFWLDDADGPNSWPMPL